MSARDSGSTVLLADLGEGAALAAELSSRASPAACYGSVEELVRERPLSSVAVLVVAFRPAPRGTLLATLGRMNLEFPAMQKVVVLEGVPPLPIVEYLTSCGADLVLDGMEGIGEEAERLALVIRRALERTGWIGA